jgi:thioredoxin:protein disulfide reductase
MTAMAARALVLALLLSAPALYAAELIVSPAHPPAFESGVLPVDEAFALSAFVEADRGIVLVWEIRPGYYLYRKSLMVDSAGSDLLPALVLPEAETLTDEFFGEVEVYRTRLLARIPFVALPQRNGQRLELLLGYQGCAEDIYCYPPTLQAITLELP